MTFKILIADDENESRHIIKEAVSAALADCDFVFAENGREALDKATSENLDLVIIDIIMPFMNGVESLKVIRMSEPDLPIIVVSGSAGNELKDEALKSGANLLFEKPIEISELATAIQKIFGVSSEGI